MESTETIEWIGDSRSRFIERAIELEIWGDYEGHPHLGRRLMTEVDQQIQLIKTNLNLYSIRENDERVVPLGNSNHILIYMKIFRPDPILLIIDIRRFY